MQKDLTINEGHALYLRALAIAYVAAMQQHAAQCLLEQDSLARAAIHAAPIVGAALGKGTSSRRKILSFSLQTSSQLSLSNAKQAE
jgi:hypothetical protein